MAQEVTSALEVEGSTATVSFGGELDVDAAEEMRSRLTAALASEGVTEVLVDLTGTEFVDSTALGALVASYNRAGPAGIAFRVVNIPSRVERLFAITGTLSLLTGGAPVPDSAGH